MSYKIEVKQVKAQPMVSVRVKCHAAEIGGVLSEILPEVWNFLEKQGVRPSGPPFTRYHGFVENQVDLEAGLPVLSSVRGQGRIESGELPGGEMLTTIHMGPYEKLPEAHDALHVWMRENGKASAGPQWELYWTDPGTEPDSSKRKTELVWPIKGA